ncbi:peptidylprolyl isomerase [Sphingomonas gellani]|nr:peptidylprolyl isomerase [Sphingomonas gellani]
MRRLASLFALTAFVMAGPAAAQTGATAPAPAAPAPVTAPKPGDLQNIWMLDLSTGGRVTIMLRPDMAPKTVERIKTLTRQHFYDGLVFHRVIDGFMAQGGDPKGDGTGGSQLPDLEAEFNALPHVRGAVSAARTDAPNTANSQFFIVFQPKLTLDKKYTVFGRVIDGMQYVDAIQRGEPPVSPSRILHAYIAADTPPPYQPAPPVPQLTPTPPAKAGANVAAPKLAAPTASKAAPKRR